MTTTSRLEVDLGAIEHNLRVIEGVLRSQSGDERTPSICAVLKQDAYGAGAPRLAKRLASMTDLLAVYSTDEARALIESAIAAPILLMMPVRSIDRFDPVYRHASTGKLHLTIHDSEQLAEVERLASQLGVHLPVHVFVDTGMGRGGATPAHADELVRSILRAPRLRLTGLMTHYAAACTDGDYTREQTRRFKAWLSEHPELTARPDLWIHASDSAATFRAHRFHGSMVRVGLAMHGFAGPGPDGTGGTFEFASEALELRPSMRWTSSIVQITDVPEGWSVGYGATWRARRPSRIAVVPVGYASGYLRGLSNAGVVGLTGAPWSSTPERTTPAPGETAYAPVVGRVSMDQITLDVTDLSVDRAFVGAEVELIGTDRHAPNAAHTLANAASTITHDLFCGIDMRIPRVYRVVQGVGEVVAAVGRRAG